MLLLFFVAFFGMEFMAWFTHKFVMHGFLWNLHEDHHTKNNPGIFEKNDAFFLIFAAPCMALFLFGTIFYNPVVLTIALGIFVYGLCYFLIHDVLIHQRLKWFRNNNNFYFRVIRKAHKVHHKSRSKEDGACFGMLIVPVKYFKSEWKRA